MFSRLLAALPLAAVLCLVPSCGKSGPTRYEVSGEVTLGGKPLPDGVIDFEPVDGKGTKAGAQILNGKYLIAKDKGLVPGQYKVLLFAGDGLAGAGAGEPGGPSGGPSKTAGKERIPPEYNEKTKLVREITKEGPNRFDFQIP